MAVHDDSAASWYAYCAFSIGAVSRTSPHARLLRSSRVRAATAVPFGSCAAHASWWLMYSSMMRYRLRFCVSPDVSSSKTSGFCRRSHRSCECCRSGQFCGTVMDAEPYRAFSWNSPSGSVRLYVLTSPKRDSWSGALGRAVLRTSTLSIHAVCWKSFGTYLRELYCAVSSSSASETAAMSPAAMIEEALLRSGSVNGPPFRENDRATSHSPLPPPGPSPSTP